MRTPTHAVLLLGALLLAGCGGEQPEDEAAETEPPQEAPADPEHEEDESVIADDLDEIADEVVADAAAEEGVDTGEVTVVTAEEVTWPDGALGCPEDDGMYTQALVEGYRVVVEVDGRELHYHGQSGQPPARCEDPQPPVDDEGTVEQ